MSIGHSDEIVRVYPVLTRINRVGSIEHNDEIVRVYPVLNIINRVCVYWTLTIRLLGCIRC